MLSSGEKLESDATVVVASTGSPASASIEDSGADSKFTAASPTAYSKNYMHIIKKCDVDPNWIYKITTSPCGIESNPNCSYLWGLSNEELDILIEKRYLYKTRMIEFHELVTNHHKDMDDIKIMMRLLNFYGLDNLIIHQYKYKTILTIIELILYGSPCANLDYCKIKIMNDFKEGGFPFSKEFGIMYNAIRFGESDIVYFLLTNGMTVENCMIHSPDKKESIYDKSCIAAALEEIIEDLKKTSESTERSFYRMLINTFDVLINFGLSKEIVYRVTSALPNPHWDWSNDYK